jgi:spoIIIJ-associated protein
MNTKAIDEIEEFLKAVTGAMGLALEPAVSDTPEGPRVELVGEGGEMLLRRKGEALDALQHIVNTLFRDRLDERQRIAIDYLGFRKDKEVELRHMAHFLAEKAKRTGLTQEIGPLNPYERRIVHMAVAEDAEVCTESIGDSFLTKVMIEVRR